MRATLGNFQQSPRKVRLIADLIRGKSVPKARTLLSFADKKSAPAVLKLLESAVSNARQSGATAENLFVKEVQVNQGLSMRRYMPMARGQAHSYRRRRSKVVLVLDARNEEKKAKAKAKPKAKKTVKKVSKTSTSKS
jgi:large subunit ribosomal protein L22